MSYIQFATLWQSYLPKQKWLTDPKIVHNFPEFQFGVAFSEGFLFDPTNNIECSLEYGILLQVKFIFNWNPVF